MSENRYYTPVGSRMKPVYASEVLKDGTVELHKTGEENWYDYIQSFKDTVDIGVILKKALAGDTSGLQKVQGFYADASKFPSDRREMLQSVIDAKEKFMLLPQEIKDRFDNDFNKFFVGMDTKEWFDKMSMPIEKIDSEVKAVEHEQ